MMPGWFRGIWKTLKPIFESIAAKAEGEPCVTHIGLNGAGHFVKMVHNGIEYSDMQLIAESYDLMRRGLGMTRPRSATCSRSGTRPNSTPTSLKSPPKCCTGSTRRPASRSSTSSSTTPA